MDRASFAYQNVFSITITVKIEQEWLSEGFNVIAGEGGQKLKEAVKESLLWPEVTAYQHQRCWKKFK